MKRLLVLSILMTPSITVAQDACDYDRQVMSVHTKKIEQSRIDYKKVVNLPGGGKKCKVVVRAKIEGKWHRGVDSFVFDTDMTEKDACSRATMRAKTKIFNRESPEYLSSSSNMKCSSSTSKERKIKQIPLPEKIPEVGETSEVRFDPRCELKPYTFIYKKGYVLQGYKEVCSD